MPVVVHEEVLQVAITDAQQEGDDAVARAAAHEGVQDGQVEPQRSGRVRVVVSEVLPQPLPKRLLDAVYRLAVGHELDQPVAAGQRRRLLDRERERERERDRESECKQRICRRVGRQAGTYT
eukprot:GHVU01157497.1.p1 GENE.GHVU01157497.1~~GHVU01157497.1.p1  ORF type:complete len:122 (-),score=11.95 GHVU01157497.1:41-406(-)